MRLARALGRDGVRLAVLDEPLRGLDRAQRHRLLAVARERWKDATLLCATHDVVEALQFDRVLVMEGGRIVADGPPQELLAEEGSPLRAMLDTERELRRELDGGRGWRRLRVADGRLREEPLDEGEADAAGAATAEDGAAAKLAPEARGEAFKPGARGEGLEARAQGEGLEARAQGERLEARAQGERLEAERRDERANGAGNEPPVAAAARVDELSGAAAGHPAGALSVFAAATILRYAAFAASWSVIGAAILDDRAGSLTTWALLLAATVPLAALAEAAEGRAAISLGARLRERTLRGALALDPSWVRREGPGRILGRSMEVDAIARLAAGGGLAAITAVIELAVGAVALLASGPGRVAAIAIAVVLALAAVVARASVRRRQAWTSARLAETDELLESIAGQRTRLIQGDHEAARRSARLDDYARLGAAADRPLAVLSGALPRVALAVALAGIALAPDLSDPSDVALALGGALLVAQALRRIAAAVETLTSASLAHRALAPILSPKSAAAAEGRAVEGRAAASQAVEGRAVADRAVADRAVAGRIRRAGIRRAGTHMAGRTAAASPGR